MKALTLSLHAVLAAAAYDRRSVAKRVLQARCHQPPREPIGPWLTNGKRWHTDGLQMGFEANWGWFHAA